MSKPLRILVATTNPGKLREIRGLLSHLPFEILGLDQLGVDPAFVETGGTFSENAQAKALHYHLLHRLPTVADDSGLVVDALDNEPGINSSRYLGKDTSYPQKMAAILERLSGLTGEERGARFTCALSFAVGGEVVATIIKHVFGRIAEEPRGSGGFGYDPIFFCPEIEATFGEASRDTKDGVSHRAQAVRALASLLETHEVLKAKLGTA